MIFPDWGSAPVQSGGGEALPLYTEWAMDWERGSFALKNGEPYIVTGSEALKIWVRCALHAESVRFAFSAHSADYGNRLADLMGQSMDGGILESCLRREIRETLMISPYITAVDGFVFARQGERMTVSFIVHTVYEELQEEVSIS